MDDNIAKLKARLVALRVEGDVDLEDDVYQKAVAHSYENKEQTKVLREFMNYYDEIKWKINKLRREKDDVLRFFKEALKNGKL